MASAAAPSDSALQRWSQPIKQPSDSCQTCREELDSDSADWCRNCGEMACGACVEPAPRALPFRGLNESVPVCARCARLLDDHTLDKIVSSADVKKTVACALTGMSRLLRSHSRSMFSSLILLSLCHCTVLAASASLLAAPSPSCSLSAPSHGELGNCPPSLPAGSSCSFGCFVGFQLSPTPSHTSCSPNGTLSAPQSCIVCARNSFWFGSQQPCMLCEGSLGCQGTNQCATGYGDYLCGQCAAGYHRVNGTASASIREGTSLAAGGSLSFSCQLGASAKTRGSWSVWVVVVAVLVAAAFGACLLATILYKRRRMATLIAQSQGRDDLHAPMLRADQGLENSSFLRPLV